MLRSVHPCVNGGQRYELVEFPQVKGGKVDCKADRIRNQFAGAGYNTKRGVINLQFEYAPPPNTATEEEQDTHIIGVMLVQQYSLKKGTELFGERADAAVKKELTQINDLET